MEKRLLYDALFVFQYGSEPVLIQRTLIGFEAILEIYVSLPQDSVRVDDKSVEVECSGTRPVNYEADRTRLRLGLGAPRRFECLLWPTFPRQFGRSINKLNISYFFRIGVIKMLTICPQKKKNNLILILL